MPSMAFEVPPQVQAVVGSQTRAKVLAYLASSSSPRTGYAIAKDLGIGVAKVYGELKRLGAAGVVAWSEDAAGRRSYRLQDEDLRRFFLRSFRITSSEEWFSADKVAERRRAFEAARAIRVEVPRAPRGSRQRLRTGEFRRAPGKDRTLARVRARAPEAPPR